MVGGEADHETRRPVAGLLVSGVKLPNPVAVGFTVIAKPIVGVECFDRSTHAELTFPIQLSAEDMPDNLIPISSSATRALLHLR
jgi:hypothetical protein